LTELRRWMWLLSRRLAFRPWRVTCDDKRSTPSGRERLAVHHNSEVPIVTSKRTAMVISAHSADFVWRAGGAIALYAERGWEITVVCLSFGERGESAKLWREPGMTLEKVKAARKEEAARAADILGANVIFFDVGDYPMRVPDSILYQLAGMYRKIRPEFILTHSLHDPYNFDHPLVSHLTQEARIVA